MKSLLLILIFTLLQVGCECYGSVQLTDWRGINSKNRILRITHDDEHVYVGTTGGIVIIDRSTNAQELIDRSSQTSHDNYILDMKIINGTLLFSGRYNGLGMISDNGLVHFNLESSGAESAQWCQGIYRFDNGDLLVGCVNALYRLDKNGQIKQSFHINDLSPMIVVTDILSNSRGEIFLSCYDWLGESSLFQYKNDELLPIIHPFGSINRLAIDSDDNIWMATDNAGLVRYDYNQFTQYSISNSNIPSNTITDISIDRNNHIWLVSSDYIIHFDMNLFTTFPSNNGILLSLDTVDNDIFVGSDHGLSVLRNGDIVSIPLIENNLPSNITSTLGSSDLNSDGTYMIVSPDGLMGYNPFSETCMMMPLPDSQLREVKVCPSTGDTWLRIANNDSCLMRITKTDTICISQPDIPICNNDPHRVMQFDDMGNLWVATISGIASFDGKTWENYNGAESGFNTENVKCLSIDHSNRIWCGTYGNGLYMYDKAVNKWTHFSSSNSSLPSDYIGCICVDNNDVVLLNCRDRHYPDSDAYGYGLTTIDDGVITTLDTNNSPIISNNIWDIKVDSDNVKYLATAGNKGMTVTDGNTWQVYNTNNSGIDMNEVLNIVMDSSRDMLWLTHYSGNVSMVKIDRNGSGSIDTLSITKEHSGESIKIYDLQGRLRHSASTYDLHHINLPAGIYICNTGKKSYKIAIR